MELREVAFLFKLFLAVIYLASKYSRPQVKMKHINFQDEKSFTPDLKAYLSYQALRDPHAKSLNKQLTYFYENPAQITIEIKRANSTENTETLKNIVRQDYGKDRNYHKKGILVYLEILTQIDYIIDENSTIEQFTFLSIIDSEVKEKTTILEQKMILLNQLDLVRKLKTINGTI